ncbi:MAG: hypothetical protein IJ960_03330 [Oscillospiraceae bacterium]|nr:hypothetical protein [Oscillospiraceae bacterium]
MGSDITLRHIKENWNPATDKRDNRAFLLSILPDCYCGAVCQNSRYVLDPDSRHSMGNSTVQGLMRGNRMSRTSTSPCPGFTSHFIQGLSANPKLDFRNSPEGREAERYDHFRDNMFHKIFTAVHSMGTPSSLDHGMFTSNDFSYFLPDTPEEVMAEFARAEQAIRTLFETPTTVSISYAVFLLIVCAIVQDRISEVSFLYHPDSLEQVYRYEHGEKLIDIPSARHRPFYDPYYFDHTYHVYKYREPHRELWDEGTLRLERLDSGRPLATLRFRGAIISPVSGMSAHERCYTGTPMYSPKDEMIYIAMADELGSFAMVTIPYQVFHYAPMYFRSGFVLEGKPTLQVPKVQKIAITAKPVPPEDLPYVKGLLKLDYGQLYLSDRQLEEFKATFAHYHWMPDFLENYEPLFQAHRKGSGLYHFNDEEILSCSMSRLEYSDRIRLLLALKSIDAPNKRELYKYILCEDPAGTHDIFKYGSDTDEDFPLPPEHCRIF